MAKRRRKANAANGSETNSAKQDLISKLPDEILTYILSFLPTLFSVATSVLSKRWKDVWISVPNLDFSDCRSLKIVSIQKFIDRVLSLHIVPNVRKIYLPCYREFNCSRVNAWISSIACRNAEKLFLYDSYLIYKIPDSFFRKEKLVKLNLQRLNLRVPPSVCFPNLKSIRLDSVQFFNNSMKNLLLGCPVLWTLNIVWRMPNDVRLQPQTMYICSSALHKLDIYTEYCPRDFIRFVIDTPNLGVLNIRENSPSTYDIINVSSLVNAILKPEVDDQVTLGVLKKGVRVKELYLLIDSQSFFIHTSLPNLPICHNVVRLTLEFLYEMSWKALPRLFHCMPKLVTLILNMTNGDLPSAWCDPNEVPRCFLSSIETVEILHMYEGGQELQMIAYILKNALVLKSLTIHGFFLKLNDAYEFVKTLLTLPRSSVGCLVDFKEFHGF